MAEATGNSGLLTVRLVSPDRLLLEATAEAVELPSSSGFLAETALRPEEIDTAAAERELEDGQKMWQEAGDDAAKYDYANAQMREAEEKLASAEGTS